MLEKSNINHIEALRIYLTLITQVNISIKFLISRFFVIIKYLTLLSAKYNEENMKNEILIRYVV